MNGRWARKMGIPRDILKGSAERFIEEQRTELRKASTRRDGYGGTQLSVLERGYDLFHRVLLALHRQPPVPVGKIASEH
ncbi:hypothetical protein KDW61_19170 [Burkholderia cenocepacia]|uniref:hypothetical protein n=1 Tax=Burkholderia TaxID=32008 RepID=UPI001589ABBE|nr:MULTISPECIES: hypothetical protein [Burkholderia]MBR8210790.1 hypothetical protein [Burkholderia cenocepacia]